MWSAACERSTGTPSSRATDRPRLILEAPRPRRSRIAWAALGAFVVIIIAAWIFAVSSTAWGPLVERALSRRVDRSATTVPNARDVALLPTPRRSELALARARGLVSGGKLRDALPLLESIRLTDPERDEADRLRADIQRQLIAIGPPSLPSPTSNTSADTNGPTR